MYTLEDIQERSESDEELVVGYADAMELLYLFGVNETQVLGWEGWVRLSDGSLGHSKKYQCGTDLSSMSNSSAIALAKSTIMQAYQEWQEKPEAKDASLLFCITTNS